MPELLQKLQEASTKNAIKTEKLSDTTAKLDATVTRLEADLSTVRRELNQLAKLPQPKAIEDGLVQLEALTNKMKTQEDLPEKLTNTIATVQGLEASWATVASKKTNLQVADIDKQVRDRMKQEREEEMRKRNMVLHNVDEPTGETIEDKKKQDTRWFIEEVATVCGVAFTPLDFEDSHRMGNDDAQKPRPLLLKLTEAAAKKKKLLFQNLNKYRDHQREKAVPENKLVSVTDDYTEEQRKQRKDLVSECKKKNSELPATATFLWAVRGPAWGMEAKKVTKKVRA